MSLLAPLFLFGALAVAAPILFHLVRRASRERTPFSSLMFLKSSQPRLAQRRRLEHLLLLLLRGLALGLLALGFARPFFRPNGGNPAAPATARRIAVLVDTSASMRRAGLWPEAQARAAVVLRTAAPEDEAAVFTFARSIQTVMSFAEWKGAPVDQRLALATGRLAAQSPGWSGTQLGDALISAAEALGETDGRQPAGPRQIVLITDLQAGSRLDALQSYEWPKGIQLVVERVTARHPTNAGLQLVAASPDADRAAATVVRVRVSNAADSQREQFQVGWTHPAAGGFIGAPIEVYVPPGQSRIVPVPVPAGAAGLEQIGLQGDDEDFDNTVHVVPPVPQRLGVLYIGSEAADDPQQPFYFLQRALPDNPHLAVVAARHAPGAEIDPAELAGASLYFVTEAPTPGVAAAIREQARQGKTIVFIPKNAAAASALGGLLNVAAPGLEDVQPDSYAMMGEIDFQHPLFAAFADPRFSDFTKIHVWKYRRLKADAIAGARVLAKFDNGDPAVLEVPLGRGRLLALLTGWNPGDSQLGVSSKFVPLIYAMLELGGGMTDLVPSYVVGDIIPVPVAVNGSVTVRGPDGVEQTLPAGATEFAGTTQPGIYGLTGAAGLQRVAVNLDPAESRTAPLGPDELERFGAPGPAPAPVAQTPRQAAMLQSAEVEGLQKLWRWCLAAALVVLLVESALAGWTARHAPAPAGGTS